MNQDTKDLPRTEMLRRVEDVRRVFEATLRQTYGINFRVALSVFDTDEPQVDDLVEAAQFLDWNSRDFVDDREGSEMYTTVWNGNGPGSDITLYGSIRAKADA